MKVNYIKTTILASAMSLMCSCVGDLDVMPLDPNIMTSEEAYSTPESYLQGLKKIYSVWALSGQDDPGASADPRIRCGSSASPAPLRCGLHSGIADPSSLQDFRSGTGAQSVQAAAPEALPGSFSDDAETILPQTQNGARRPSPENHQSDRQSGFHRSRIPGSALLLP